MKVIAVGSFEFADQEALDELRDKPIVVLTGSFDEIREAGALLYQDVHVTPRPGPSPSEEPK